MAEIKFSDEEKDKIVALYKKDPSISSITARFTGDPNLDGRSKYGRAIRSFLTDQGIQYKSTKYQKMGRFELSEDQKSFIATNVENMGVMEMTKVLFPNKGIKSSLNKEPKAIRDFIRQNGLKLKKLELAKTYAPPRNIKEAVNKVNQFALEEIDYNEITSHNKRNLGALIKFCRAPRFKQVCDNYSTAEDRELFESEYIRYVWDKPDLTNEEITLYINVCIDMVTAKSALKHVQRLNEILEEAMGDSDTTQEDVQSDLSIRLSEALKTKQNEYNELQKRIERNINQLNGKRVDRIKNMRAKTGSFLSLVEAMQEEKERQKIVRLSMANRLKAKEEVDRLESMNEFKARIFGLTKEEAM